MDREEAINRLLSEIEKGRQSGDTEGWLSIEEVERHFREKAEEFRNQYPKRSRGHWPRLLFGYASFSICWIFRLARQ